MKSTRNSFTLLVIWPLFEQLGPILRQRAKYFSDVLAALGLWFWHWLKDSRLGQRGAFDYSFCQLFRHKKRERKRRMWSVGVRPRSAAHRIDQQIPASRCSPGLWLFLPSSASVGRSSKKKKNKKTNPSSDLVSFQIYTAGMPTFF